MNGKCHVEPIVKTISHEEAETTESVWLKVAGMGCENCATRVHNGLLALHGVVDVQVNHVTATAAVLYNPRLLSLPDLADAIAGADASGRHHYRVVTTA